MIPGRRGWARYVNARGRASARRGSMIPGRRSWARYLDIRGGTGARERLSNHGTPGTAWQGSMLQGYRSCASVYFRGGAARRIHARGNSVRRGVRDTIKAIKSIQRSAQVVPRGSAFPCLVLFCLCSG